MSEDYFVIPEEINNRRDTMVVMDVYLDNFYAFKNFHMNLSYPKKIVGSCIKDECLPGRPNFRYKKVNIIMGANATGKTSFGHALMTIFNFIDKKNFEFITEIIGNPSKEAQFTIDLASKTNVLYHVICRITPRIGEEYTAENINLSIQKERINGRDSYESCLKRLVETEYIPNENLLEELKKIEPLDWLFENLADTMRTLRFPKNDKKFTKVLQNILRALDPSIKSVEESKDAENAYVIRLQDRAVILQDGAPFATELLSSGTKAGIEVARVVSSLMQGLCSFYYCDEKFPYIHSDFEKAILSLMIDFIGPTDQLFFTTHNTDILDMNLPKHSFIFLRKDLDNEEMPINCIDASSLLKRSTDSLKNAVENDMFATAPAVDLVYDIADF